MKHDEREVFLPPLRPYEMPDTPATVLDLAEEPDTFVIPGEQMTDEERRSMAQPVSMSPLHTSEMPETMVSVLDVQPDSRLDDRDWGTARPAPEITIRKGKLLHPWDD